MSYFFDLIIINGFSELKFQKLFSGATPTQRRASASAANDLHVRPDAETRTGVPEERVHLQAQEVRARRVLGSDRNPDQDLVPEPASQGQED